MGLNEDIYMVLHGSGEYDNLKDLLKKRLKESGWINEVTRMVKEAGNRREILRDVLEMERSRVPDEVKQELVQKVKESLLLLKNEGVE